MEKPEIRIIEPQSVESGEIQLSQSEIDSILANSGFNIKYNEINPNSNMTFEQLLKLEEEKKKIKNINPITFNKKDIKYCEDKWNDIEIDEKNSFGIKIQITSDMKI